MQTVHTARSRSLEHAMPPVRARMPGLLLGWLADLTIVGLLGLSMWLIVRSGEQPPILHLTFAIVGVRALAIGRAAFRYLERLQTHNAALAQLVDLRTHTFEQLIPRMPGAIQREQTGDVLARLVDDVDQLQDQPLRVWQPIMSSAMVTLASLIVILLLSPIAGIILFIAILLGGGVASITAIRLTSRGNAQVAEARGVLADALLERFEAATVLHAFDAGKEQQKRITDAEQVLTKVQRRNVGASALAAAVLALVAGATSLVTLLALQPGLSDSTLSAPLFAALVIVPAAVFEVFGAIPVALQARAQVKRSALRVDQLVETPIPREIPIDQVGNSDKQAEFVDASSALSLRPEHPALAVENLSVRYPDSDTEAVSNITFTLSLGETLVISGESGSGKSTIALALVRLLEYDGSYLLGGVEARNLPIDHVRQSVGLSEQQPHLFDSDLRQNLKFARDTASDEELYEVLDRVGLAEWARERGGLDMRVGEHGALVSGGQAQRIALARVLLANFPVIILDEPTAGVDVDRAAALLTDLMSAVPEDRAVLLITHTQVPQGITAKRLELLKK